MEDAFAFALNSNFPTALRYPKTKTRALERPRSPFAIGKAEIVFSGDDCSVIGMRVEVHFAGGDAADANELDFAVAVIGKHGGLASGADQCADTGHGIHRIDIAILVSGTISIEHVVPSVDGVDRKRANAGHAADVILHPDELVVRLVYGVLADEVPGCGRIVRVDVDVVAIRAKRRAVLLPCFCRAIPHECIRQVCAKLFVGDIANGVSRIDRR